MYRGKRKSGEAHFGPHPQILKKLADVYHVSPGQLFERAGYLDNDAQNASGFSEQREMDRIFDFVITDPMLKQELSLIDKRAIIQRYEALTAKRLITWAGETPNPSSKKPESSGIRSMDGTLFADTPHNHLTLSEVAQELGTDESEVRELVKNLWLKPIKDKKPMQFDKQELRQFKVHAITEGLKFCRANKSGHEALLNISSLENLPSSTGSHDLLMQLRSQEKMR